MDPLKECYHCKQKVLRSFHNQHKKVCPMRRVECEYCRAKMEAIYLEEHVKICSFAPVECGLCGLPFERDDFDSHWKNVCKMRDVRCPHAEKGCQWKGPLINLESHEEECAYTIATCDWCLEEMEQYKMPSHTCPMLTEFDHCVICMESFGLLMGRGIPGTILLKDSRRVCEHRMVCMLCADEWKDRSQECPVCRGSFDSVTGFPEHLFISGSAANEDMDLDLDVGIDAEGLSADEEIPEELPEELQEEEPEEMPEELPQELPVPPPPPPPPADDPPSSRRAQASVRAAVAIEEPASLFQASRAPHAQHAPADLEPRVQLAPAAQQPPAHWAPPSQALPVQMGTPAAGQMGSSTIHFLTPVPTWPAIQPVAQRSPVMATTKMVRPVERRRPLPPKERMRPGTAWWVSPLDIRFTHDTIHEHFRPFTKNGKKVSRLSILDSAEELLKTKEVRGLELIDVVWYDDKLFVAGTFNRRLCMWRLLAIFAANRFALIKVRVVGINEKQVKFRQKLTTQCEGIWVEIKHNRFVGKSRSSVKWRDAHARLGALAQAGAEDYVEPSAWSAVPSSSQCRAKPVGVMPSASSSSQMRALNAGVMPSASAGPVQTVVLTPAQFREQFVSVVPAPPPVPQVRERRLSDPSSSQHHERERRPSQHSMPQVHETVAPVAHSSGMNAVGSASAGSGHTHVADVANSSGLNATGPALPRFDWEAWQASASSASIRPVGVDPRCFGSQQSDPQQARLQISTESVQMSQSSRSAAQQFETLQPIQEQCTYQLLSHFHEVDLPGQASTQFRSCTFGMWLERDPGTLWGLSASVIASPLQQLGASCLQIRAIASGGALDSWNFKAAAEGKQQFVLQPGDYLLCIDSVHDGTRMKYALADTHRRFLYLRALTVRPRHVPPVAPLLFPPEPPARQNPALDEPRIDVAAARQEYDDVAAARQEYVDVAAARQQHVDVAAARQDRQASVRPPDPPVEEPPAPAVQPPAARARRWGRRSGAEASQAEAANASTGPSGLCATPERHPSPWHVPTPFRQHIPPAQQQEVYAGANPPTTLPNAPPFAGGPQSMPPPPPPPPYTPPPGGTWQTPQPPVPTHSREVGGCSAYGTQAGPVAATPVDHAAYGALAGSAAAAGPSNSILPPVIDRWTEELCNDGPWMKLVYSPSAGCWSSFCTLCDEWADQGHLSCERHLRAKQGVLSAEQCVFGQ